MGKWRGLDLEPGWIQRRLTKLERDLAELAAARRLVVATDFKQTDLNSTDLTSAWTNYVVTPVNVPVGYNRAIVQVSASAGSTVSGDLSSANWGNIGVQPAVSGVSGPALSQGRSGGGAMSINSSLSAKITVTPGGVFNVWALAYAQASGLVAGSGNVHLSATVLFIRE